MKRVLIFPASCVPFHGKSLEERPLGGTETGIARLAQALHRQGVEVVVGSEFKNPPLTDPLYVPLPALSLERPFDAVIAVRDWRALFVDFGSAKRFLWTGDSFDQPITFGLGDRRVIRRIDRILCVSKWHRRTLCEASGFPAEKTAVLRNAVAPTLYDESIPVERNAFGMLYSSMPYRGLALLLVLFPRIREAVPQATLTICSGFDVYSGKGAPPPHEVERFEAMKRRFEKMDGVTLRGNLLQRELALEMRRASILAYPNIFPETSCITAMEAKAAGTVVVSSKLAGLSETVGRAGVLIPGDPRSTQYQDSFVEACTRLMSDRAEWGALSEIARAESATESWERRATELLTML